ncbi:MAG: cyclodeaminase/cyclohydrolase family protein [Acidobacteriota bacterium]
MLVNKTVSEILDAFASTDPTPGGGSASALAGAVGASLLLMVAHMQKTRTSPEADRGALERAASLLEPAAAELRGLIDRDTAAYDAVVAAYRLPKASDAEKAARKEAIQKAMREAIEAPLGVMRACRTALAQLPLVEAHGNPNAASDVQVGRALLSAGLAGARANVEINLPSIADAEYVARVREEI